MFSVQPILVCPYCEFVVDPARFLHVCSHCGRPRTDCPTQSDDGDDLMTICVSCGKIYIFHPSNRTSERMTLDRWESLTHAELQMASEMKWQLRFDRNVSYLNDVVAEYAQENSLPLPIAVKVVQCESEDPLADHLLHVSNGQLAIKSLLLHLLDKTHGQVTMGEVYAVFSGEGEEQIPDYSNN